MELTIKKIQICCLVFCSLIFSCGNNTNKAETKTINKPIQKDLVKQESVKDDSFYWEGTINENIPVILNYTLTDSLITGYITYPNTTEKKPIKVIGTLEDGGYRLLEFEKTGNITGILSGAPQGNSFDGTWFSPKTTKEFPLSLKLSKPTKSHAKNSSISNTVFGEYTYQYAKDGYTGTLKISDLGEGKAAFSISALTSGPAYNMADLETDTITFNGNTFRYPLPDSDNCEIEVSFYPGFAYVKYTTGPCDGYFGHNATVEGVFLKVR